MTIGLLYYRFPSDSLKGYLLATADRLIPRHIVSFNEIGLTFPPGLKLMQPGLSLRETPDARLFTADSLLIRPMIGSFIKGKNEYYFACQANSGDVTGCIDFVKNSIDSPISTSIQLKDIHIDDYATFPMIGRDIRGVLCGKITYSGQYQSLIYGAGEADLLITGGHVELLEPIANFDSIDFNDLRIKMILEKQKINLTGVELRGELIQGTLSGSINLKTDLSRSILDLKGTLEPLAGIAKGNTGAMTILSFLKKRMNKGKLSFVISGTLGEPAFRFI